MTKYIFNILCGLLISSILFSCSKQLNELPPNTLVAENSIRDETTAKTAINGMYSYFGDRKSTRLNSSHVKISYAVFCLKKKKISIHDEHASPGWDVVT